MSHGSAPARQANIKGLHLKAQLEHTSYYLGGTIPFDILHLMLLSPSIFASVIKNNNIYTA